MLAKFIRLFGLFLIVGFSAVSIFFSLVHRDMEEGPSKEMMSYPSYFEGRFYDYRASLTRKKDNFDKRIVLAQIDDPSLQEIGSFPWARTIYADLLHKLNTFGAKVVSFDVFFPEKQRACPGENPDGIFAQAIKDFEAKPGNKVILGYTMDAYGAEYFKEPPEHLLNFMIDTKQTGDATLVDRVVSKAAYPIPTIANTEAGLGHVQTKQDTDGIYRQYELLSNVDGLTFPSFSLLTYEKYADDRASLEVTGLGDGVLTLKNGKVGLNHQGETKVNWLGNEKSFPAVSIIDILKAKDDDQKMKEIFDSNIVFIGSIAFGAHDLRHTPVDPMTPGVYFHMNVVHMLLDGWFFKPKDDSTLISWALLIGGTLIIILIQLIGHALLDILAVLLLSAGAFFADTYYLIPKGYDVKLFFCLFSIVSCYSWNTLISFYFANKDKQFLKNAFGNYISPELIDDMYKTGEAPKLGGDAGIRTAYFTDIQGFSTFSEKLTATKLVELLNEYLTAMTDILLEEKGTLDKYEGDAIIAFFGAPMPLEDHAIRACTVAIRMQESLINLRKKWVSEGDKWPTIVHEMRMRIGINSGEIVTGNMGSTSRMNYTMMGDSVNLAARLEEAAKQYGIFTQVSQFTKDLTGNIFVMRELDTIQVVGKSEPVTTFDLLGMAGKTEPFLIELADKFKSGIDLYKGQHWDEALKIFEHTLELEHQRFPLLKDKKTNPSLIYIERCKLFKENPPAKDWDGVFTLTSK